ncbi:hypothetical protein CLV63_1558 [Murinocardiopsis flavida]|uniref:Uncharacterized protein n=1 Tax=Murinocardiopsis flavida TaxID=645275 RepID=A0A2P8C669_9ACTN|nr:RRQRL motif-containing zinc-binding protein [Murinocardiopsis flavida]PSK80460.1 hypothetical protein CLV63_1558 [Murinocardiopsis flavida]
MSFTRFYDPDATRHGLATWPWGHAPAHLATKKQLAARGLRPGGQEPAGQIRWRSRRAPPGARGVREALLYRIEDAVPKRVPTPAVLASLARAMRARRTCPTCRLTFVYCLPTSLGECAACAFDTEVDPNDVEAA